MSDSKKTVSVETAEETGVPGGRNLMYAMRILHRNQTQLVGLADRKANALIGIVMVVLSILLAKSDVIITWPLFLKMLLGAFFVSELLAVYFALLVIFPQNICSSSRVSMSETGNPLFFGCFSQCSQEEFVRYLSEEFEEDARARELLLCDYYQIGCVLKKKYAILRRAYVSAAAGMVLMCGLLAGLLLA